MFFNMVKVRVIKYVLIEDANNLSRMNDKINVLNENRHNFSKMSLRFIKFH